MNSNIVELFKTTGILSIGTFGSKILGFLIIPFYTSILTPTDYGTIDLFITSVSLMIPFVTVQIQESLIRYIAGKEYPIPSVLNNSFLVFIFGVFISTLLIPVYQSVMPEYYLLYYACLISTSFFGIFSHYLRLIGKNVAFSVSGIINTVITIIANIIFLFVLNMGVAGYIYATILAQVISGVYVAICSDMMNIIDYKYFSKDVMIKLVSYSLPLIPNSIIWWIINAGDKYIINAYLGTEANGIFALAMKIPTVIQMFYSIFIMAWQISAIETMNNRAAAEFYNKIIDYITFSLTLVTGLIIFVVKPMFLQVFNSAYSFCWIYVPFLCIAMIFSCYASFFGVFYNVYQESKMVLYTTLLGAIVNILLNIIFINIIGLHGVVIGTLGGFLVMMVVRKKDAVRLSKITMPLRKLWLSCMILSLEALLIMNLKTGIGYMLSLICVLGIVLINFNSIKLKLKSK